MLHGEQRSSSSLFWPSVHTRPSVVFTSRHLQRTFRPVHPYWVRVWYRGFPDTLLYVATRRSTYVYISSLFQPWVAIPLQPLPLDFTGFPVIGIPGTGFSLGWLSRRIVRLVARYVRCPMMRSLTLPILIYFRWSVPS